MAKMVIYNGGRDSYFYSSSPNHLEKGKQYKVIEIMEGAFHTTYRLEGMKGEYNSIWFDEIVKTYMAISYEKPIVGKEFICRRLENGAWTRTTLVKKVTEVHNNVYKVETMNSVYIVQVTGDTHSVVM